MKQICTKHVIDIEFFIAGWSALMWATTNKHESLVKVLMDHGASAQTRSAKGRTVFDFVQSSNSNEKIAEILATNPRDSLSSSMSCTSSSAGDCDFYYQSTVEGYDSFMAEEAERRQKLLETAMALVGGDSTLIDNTHDDDDENDDYDNAAFNHAANDDDQDDDEQDDDLTTEFYWDKCMPDQMFVFGGDDLTHILDTMITNIRLPMETQQEICVPANVVFLSARFAHYFSSSELLDEVLEGALSRMSKIAKVCKKRTSRYSLMQCMLILACVYRPPPPPFLFLPLAFSSFLLVGVVCLGKCPQHGCSCLLDVEPGSAFVLPEKGHRTRGGYG